jgi:release factor glutamine methyltransferase
MPLIAVSAEYLADHGVENARLDAELLLAHVLRVERLKLYLDHDRPIVPEELSAYRELVRRRGRREPLQLLVGRVSLLEHDFAVREGVFVPRPETETLILQARECELPAEPRLLEVGVGSGCVGLSLLTCWPDATLLGYDVEPLALELTAENARGLAVESRLELREGSAFDARLDPESFDLVVSNPPYVRSAELADLEPEVRDHDPREALDGGEDGLEAVRRLVDLARRVLRPQGWLLFEHGYDQGESAPALLRDAGFGDVVTVEDLGGRPRVTRGRRA